MHWPQIKLSSSHLATLKGLLKGLARGGAAGIAASVLTGAALMPVPAGAPVVAGLVLLSMKTVATWGLIGTLIGALSGGVWAWWRQRQVDREFEAVFGVVRAVA